MHLFHKWGPWFKGTAFETLGGVRTGNTYPARGRECEVCRLTEVKQLYR